MSELEWGVSGGGRVLYFQVGIRCACWNGTIDEPSGGARGVQDVKKKANHVCTIHFLLIVLLCITCKCPAVKRPSLVSAAGPFP